MANVWKTGFGWRAATNGANKMRWFVFHVENHQAHGLYHNDSRGQFASFEAADRRATELNTEFNYAGA